jgi:hypothetical protein
MLGNTGSESKLRREAELFKSSANPGNDQIWRQHLDHLDGVHTYHHWSDLGDEVWVVVLGRVDGNFDRMFVDHISQTNVTDVHRGENLAACYLDRPFTRDREIGEYLIFLRRLGKRAENFEGRGVKCRMALGVYKLEEEFQRDRGFCEFDHLSLGGDVRGRKAFSAYFKILAMDMEKDAVRRLENDVSAGRVDWYLYSQFTVGFSHQTAYIHLGDVEVGMVCGRWHSGRSAIRRGHVMFFAECSERSTFVNRNMFEFLEGIWELGLMEKAAFHQINEGHQTYISGTIGRRLAITCC